ncbi:MAG: sulfate adenylyltransferase subunit CysN [Allosphingosinicella sp.]
MATVLKEAAPAEAARAATEAYVEATGRRSLLRFITCGSVDDGKSTLIGRLLYDSKMLFDDQLEALGEESRRSGAAGGGLDFSLLVDGLAAEREQGITIDVAYRFFATRRRKFIVADTPGHEQYTRNMVTGASTADLAVILIDARKGVLPQTRRHSYIVRLLGIRSVVLAVNKMDLVGYDEARFEAIVEEYGEFAREAGIESFTAIPLSGLAGDNVTERSDAMPWYEGPALLEHLETVPVTVAPPGAEPFRMAVQWVNRGSGFRGYAGRIASGRIRVGDEIKVLPAGRRSRVSRIVAFGGDLDEAVAGQSVTLCLADEVDCSRGDLLAAPGGAPDAVRRLEATLVWMGEEAMVPHRDYWLKIGTRTVSASVSRLNATIDIEKMTSAARTTLALNDIGEVAIDLDRPTPALRYEESRRLGGFILIDKVSHATVAAGLVRELAREPAATRRDEGSILWVGGTDRDEQARRRAERMKALGRPAFVLDEAALAGLVSDLAEVRQAELVRRTAEVAKLMSRAGVHVLVTLDVPPGQAVPGKRIDGAAGEEEADEWVI